MLGKLNSVIGKVQMKLLIMNLILMKNVSHTGGFNYNPQHSSDNAETSAFNAESILNTHRVAKRMELDLESCLAQFDVHKNTIIRTGESQAIGGKYLQGLEMSNSLECQRLCCETESCDVFIFEDKNEGYCYLFKCGPPENFHCKFTRHANYTSAVLTSVRQGTLMTTTRPRVPHIGIMNISQQEWELANLKTKPEVHEEKMEGIPTATVPITGMSMPLGYNNSAHCGRFQFMCHSGECIAVYNACDGIPQCEDGSDEGPECSGASSNSVLLVDKLNTKPATVGPQYQNPLLQQTSQQQLQSLQHRPPTVPLLINNREDAAARTNRKLAANTLQIEPENLGGLQLSSNLVHVLSNSKVNSDLKPMYTDMAQKEDASNDGRNAIYTLPNRQQEITQNHVSGNWGPSQLQNQQIATNSPGLVQLPQETIYFSKSNVQQSEQTLLPPATTSVLDESAVLQTIDVNTKPDREKVEENKDYKAELKEERAYEGTYKKSVETQEKNQLNPDNKNFKSAETMDHQQQYKAPVHEQYKIIHTNLAMEFHNHDHDGHADRPNGAVLSLTLGLLITAALAILIGCRMRTVGKATRRVGKTPYSHDADFLVNGMYL